MSTRATYSFHDNEHDTLTTLYIHFDGYEEMEAVRGRTLAHQ